MLYWIWLRQLSEVLLAKHARLRSDYFDHTTNHKSRSSNNFLMSKRQFLYCHLLFESSFCDGSVACPGQVRNGDLCSSCFYPQFHLNQLLEPFHMIPYLPCHNYWLCAARQKSKLHETNVRWCWIRFWKPLSTCFSCMERRFTFGNLSSHSYKRATQTDVFFEVETIPVWYDIIKQFPYDMILYNSFRMIWYHKSIPVWYHIINWCHIMMISNHKTILVWYDIIQ